MNVAIFTIFTIFSVSNYNKSFSLLFLDSHEKFYPMKLRAVHYSKITQITLYTVISSLLFRFKIEEKDDDQVIEVGGRVESDGSRDVDRLPDRNLNVLTVDDFRFAI